MDFDWRQARRNRILSLILLVLVVAVLIVGGYRWRQLRRQQVLTPDGQLVTIAPTRHKYDALSYKYNNVTLSFTVDQETDRWKWDGNPDFPLDPTVVEEICADLANLKPQQTLAAEVDESYGLDTPAATITALSGDETTTLVFGKTTTDGASYYTRMNDDDTTIYIYDGAILENLGVAIYDMALLPELPALTAENMETISVNGQASTILSAQRPDGDGSATWRAGGANVTDVPEVKALMEDLAQMTLVKCVDFRPSDEALEICGFSEAVTLRVDYRTGSEEQRFLMRVGAVTLDGTGRYVRLDDNAAIYQIPVDQLDAMLALAAGLEG